MLLQEGGDGVGEVGVDEGVEGFVFWGGLDVDDFQIGLGVDVFIG